MPESLISDPIALADKVTGYFLFADPKFVDVTDESLHCWDGREYTCVGLRLDHKAPGGNKCSATVSFVNAKNMPETTDEWVVESRDPVTISPALECGQVDRFGLVCDFKGSVTDGQWVPANTGGQS
jgi:hypothetical protein